MSRPHIIAILAAIGGFIAGHFVPVITQRSDTLNECILQEMKGRQLAMMRVVRDTCEERFSGDPQK